VSEQIEAIGLEGQTVRVAVSPALPMGLRLLALAVALRVFRRYPVFDRVTLSTGREEASVSRDTIVRQLGSDGFAPLADTARYRQTLYDLYRAEASEGQE
jgi:hypothetical protein